MKNKLDDLREAMDTTTHKGQHFSEEQKRNIRRAVHSDKGLISYGPNKIFLFAVSIMAAVIVGFLVSSEILLKQSPENSPSNSVGLDDWGIRNEYVEGNKLKFSVFPDPYLKAGKPFGYIFRFEEPFERFYNKELAIYATNKKTGDKITALPPIRITETSPGYSSLQRFTATFEIPYGGLWKYEVFLNGEIYGNVILELEDPVELPEDIPEFVQPSDFEEIDWNRKAVVFNSNMIGNQNKAGVIGADMPSLQGQKWMWHLWGITSSELTVVGFHRDSQTIHRILENGWNWTTPIGGPVNGADATALSTVKIPQKGEWAILLYDGNQLFDVLVYTINE